VTRITVYFYAGNVTQRDTRFIKKEITMSKDELVTLSELEINELLGEIQKRGYYIAKTPVTRSGATFRGDLKRWHGNTYKFGVVSDTHLCSRYQALSALWDFYRILARRKIETCFHCGDLLEGSGKLYRGQEFEIFVHGADAQTEYAINNYPKAKGVQTIIISGNHDLSFLSLSGYNPVAAVARAREDITYLGDNLAFVQVDVLKVALMHGSGGGAYARSYKGQKIAESFSSENKPNFLFLGHYHSPNIITGYRNIEVVQMSCFQYQTPFEAARALQPFIAGLIVTVQVDERGASKIIYEWIPFYVQKKDDY
jgi:predicted phosphodiesterase